MSFTCHSQNGFRFKNTSQKKQRLSFELINNLVVIPVYINNKKMSFILDTGVNKTIIFNLSENDSIGLLNPEKVSLRGLGDGESVEAIISRNNKLQVKNAIGNNESVYVILKDFFDLSSKMGTTIHGIIGYNLLKDFVVRINYKTKKIDFYNPDSFKYKRCKKCEVLPIQFYRKKPFVEVDVQLDTVNNVQTPVKMLVDSGGSDAIWLFENSKAEIKTPLKYFNDLLGEGLSGSIYGNRSRIPKLIIGKYEIKSPTVSFLDSLSTQNASMLKERNGSIGGNILKRFMVWIDYPKKKITLRKNASFKSDFNYNMSGLDIVYNGKQLVKEEIIKPVSDSFNNDIQTNNTISFVANYTYKFKPSYIIKNVVKNSPADRAGLQPGDILSSINRKPVHSYKLNEIVSKMQERANKKITITVLRYGSKKTFQFRLEKRI
ncbi:aspartyl protease family protein [Polaribacter sp. KT 15]|uniref:aspartyl protease family protein n=1 Tax=Polaribacter sp. KT 15 TaxID=1896175 RepID=UPI0026754626|nr:aspartyl protease family protein [Polaribacter sp. KT 15]